MFIKFARNKISNVFKDINDFKSFVKTAGKNDKQYQNRILTKIAGIPAIKNNPENFTYLRNRSISSGEFWGANQNYDYFPDNELKTKVSTFLNCRIDVDHICNGDEDIIGMVVDSMYINPQIYVVSKNILKPYNENVLKELMAKGEQLKVIGGYIENLLAIDNERAELHTPGLVTAIKKGEVTDTSMGCSVKLSECSVCGNKAESEDKFCDHIKYSKGKMIESKLCYEINHGLEFFEDSIILSDDFARKAGKNAQAGGEGADQRAKILEVLNEENDNKSILGSIKKVDIRRDVNDLKLVTGDVIEFEFKGKQKKSIISHIEQDSDGIKTYVLKDGTKLKDSMDIKKVSNLYNGSAGEYVEMGEEPSEITDVKDEIYEEKEEKFKDSTSMFLNDKNVLTERLNNFIKKSKSYSEFESNVIGLLGEELSPVSVIKCRSFYDNHLKQANKNDLLALVKGLHDKGKTRAEIQTKLKKMNYKNDEIIEALAYLTYKDGYQMGKTSEFNPQGLKVGDRVINPNDKSKDKEGIIIDLIENQDEKTRAVVEYASYTAKPIDVKYLTKVSANKEKALRRKTYVLKGKYKDGESFEHKFKTFNEMDEFWNSLLWDDDEIRWVDTDSVIGEEISGDGTVTQLIDTNYDDDRSVGFIPNGTIPDYGLDVMYDKNKIKVRKGDGWVSGWIPISNGEFYFGNKYNPHNIKEIKKISAFGDKPNLNLQGDELLQPGIDRYKDSLDDDGFGIKDELGEKPSKSQTGQNAKMGNPLFAKLNSLKRKLSWSSIETGNYSIGEMKDFVWNYDDGWYSKFIIDYPDGFSGELEDFIESHKTDISIDMDNMNYRGLKKMEKKSSTELPCNECDDMGDEDAEIIKEGDDEILASIKNKLNKNVNNMSNKLNSLRKKLANEEYVSDNDYENLYSDLNITELNWNSSGNSGSIEMFFGGTDPLPDNYSDDDLPSSKVDNFIIYDNGKIGFDHWYPENVQKELTKFIMKNRGKNLQFEQRQGGDDWKRAIKKKSWDASDKIKGGDSIDKDYGVAKYDGIHREKNDVDLESHKKKNVGEYADHKQFRDKNFSTDEDGMVKKVKSLKLKLNGGFKDKVKEYTNKGKDFIQMHNPMNKKTVMTDDEWDETINSDRFVPNKKSHISPEGDEKMEDVQKDKENFGFEFVEEFGNTEESKGNMDKELDRKVKSLKNKLSGEIGMEQGLDIKEPNLVDDKDAFTWDEQDGKKKTSATTSTVPTELQPGSTVKIKDQDTATPQTQGQITEVGQQVTPDNQTETVVTMNDGKEYSTDDFSIDKQNMLKELQAIDFNDESAKYEDINEINSVDISDDLSSDLNQLEEDDETYNSRMQIENDVPYSDDFDSNELDNLLLDEDLVGEYNDSTDRLAKKKNIRSGFKVIEKTPKVVEYNLTIDNIFD